MNNVCLMHSMDLFGNKVGGLETYVRDFITYCPEKYNLLFVGVATNDDPVGVFQQKVFRGRDVTVFNVMRACSSNISGVSRNPFKSLTANFLIGLLRYNIVLSEFLKSNNYIVDLRRVEFSLFCILKGVTYIQMLHGVGAPKENASSLLHKFNFIHDIFERYSIRECEYFFCVNKYKSVQLKEEYPSLAHKIKSIGTWADKSIYIPTPFQLDDVIDLSFIGRLDAVKDPELMFEVVRVLKSKNVKVLLHIIGPDDPSKIKGFSQIEEEIVHYGYKTSQEIAEILRSIDMGILFSHFEGMPRCIIETISSGRPVVTTNFIAVEELVSDNVNGFISKTRNSEDIADLIIDVWGKIKSDDLNPDILSKTMSEYSPSTQLKKVLSTIDLIGNLKNV